MNQKVKSKHSFSYVTLILIVTAVLVVAVLGYHLVDSIGLIGRMNKAAKSDHITLNENELDVYRYHVAQNQLYTEYMYYQYGMMQDTQGITKRFASPAEYANAMIPMYVGTDMYDSSAYKYAEQYLTYCEGAKEAGLYDEYETAAKKDVDSYMDDLKDLAKANGVSLSKYIKKWIGNGVSQKDVRRAMTWYSIGIEYADKLNEDYKKAATNEEIEHFRDEHKDQFYSTKYAYYKLVNNDMKDDIEKCKTVDEVKTVITEYFVKTKFDDLYKEKIEKAEIKHEGDKDTVRSSVKTTLLAINKIGDAKAVFTSEQTSTFEKAAYSIVTSINTSLEKELKKVNEEGSAAYTDPTDKKASDLQKWLFDAGRKAGEINTIKTESTTKDPSGKNTTTVSYTWYLVKDVMVLDHEKTKNAYYISFRDDDKKKENAKTAVEKAAEMMEEFKKDPTSEKFVELAAKFAPGTPSDLHENISKKSVPDEVGEWLYKEGRKKGDFENIKLKDGGNFIVLYESENDETWLVNGREGVAGDKLNVWYEDAVIKYHVTIDYEAPTAPTPSTSADTKAETTADTKADTSAETKAETSAETSAETETKAA